MKSHDLARQLLELPDCETTCSVGMLDEDKKHYRSVFSDRLYALQYESDGSGVALLFAASWDNEDKS